MRQGDQVSYLVEKRTLNRGPLVRGAEGVKGTVAFTKERTLLEVETKRHNGARVQASKKDEGSSSRRSENSMST